MKWLALGSTAFYSRNWTAYYCQIMTSLALLYGMFVWRIIVHVNMFCIIFTFVILKSKKLANSRISLAHYVFSSPDHLSDNPHLRQRPADNSTTVQTVGPYLPKHDRPTALSRLDAPVN